MRRTMPLSVMHDRNKVWLRTAAKLCCRMAGLWCREGPTIQISTRVAGTAGVLLLNLDCQGMNIKALASTLHIYGFSLHTSQSRVADFCLMDGPQGLSDPAGEVSKGPASCVR